MLSVNVELSTPFFKTPHMFLRPPFVVRAIFRALWLNFALSLQLSRVYVFSDDITRLSATRPECDIANDYPEYEMSVILAYCLYELALPRSSGKLIKKSLL